MKRRKFLKSMLTFFSAAALVSFSYPLLRFFAPPRSDTRVQKMSIPKKDVPVGEAKEIVFNNTPAIVINRPGKGFIALSKVCTHLGCLVEYEKGKKRLFCPCHAGIYDLEGNVVSGPPPKPLPKFPISVEGEKIIIG